MPDKYYKQFYAVHHIFFVKGTWKSIEKTTVVTQRGKIGR